MDAHKPRIGGKELDDYSDQAVILVGKIDANTAFQGAQIVASDGASVEVDFADQQSDLSPYVEITGKVLESGRIEGWAVANLGDSFVLLSLFRHVIYAFMINGDTSVRVQCFMVTKALNRRF
eukprot:TRINITY_DN1800_c0_g1_i2.p1 TRINITY_DN1800_c0_g1~~TRINITY_DN1800_c0_g1_i2.p1  ORF type:complete len:122 (+),score=18.27 TRINITY_DN1800_c0_g1_i2:111-476(+)